MNGLITKPNMLTMISRLVRHRMRYMSGIRAIGTLHEPDSVVTDSSNLILTLANIRRECNLRTGSQGTVVIGNQSSGKTSFVEAMIGTDSIFEKHSGAATRRPTRINVYNVAEGLPYVKFGTFGEKIYDMNVVRRKMIELNSGDFDPKPIEIIYGTPHVPDMLITDYPGYISTTKAGESDDLPTVIEDMCRPAIEDDSAFKIVVMNGTVDRAGSIAIREIKKAGQFDNTLGVLTRCDLLVDSDHGRSKLIENLKDKDYLPGLGVVGVILRSATQLENGVTIEEQIENEKKFIEKYKLGTEHVPDIRMGIPTVREIVSQRQIKDAVYQLPLLEEEVKKMIEKKENNKIMLKKLASGNNLTKVASAMEEMVGNLHPVSPTRLLLERDMRSELSKVIHGKVNIAFRELFGNINPSYDVTTTRTTTSTPQLLRHSRKVLESASANFKNYDDADMFEQTCIFGSCATSLSETEMDLSYVSHIYRKMTMPFFRFDMTKDSHENRITWVKKLNRCIDKILVDEDLAEQCRQTAISTIVKKVEDYQPETDDNLSHTFFEFILDKITERTDNDGLVDSINRMVAREKRPFAEPHDLSYYASIHSGLSWTKKIGLFDTELYPKIYPVYGDVWTLAYKDVLIERMEREIYRTFSVNVNDPLIRETFELAFRFFQGKNFSMEEEQLEESIKRMRKYMDVIRKVGLEATRIKKAESDANKIKIDQLSLLEQDRQVRNRLNKLKTNIYLVS